MLETLEEYLRYRKIVSYKKLNLHRPLSFRHEEHGDD